MLIKASELERAAIVDYCMSEPNFNIFILGDIENFGFEGAYLDIWIQYLEDRITGVVLRYHDNLLLYSKAMDMDFWEVKALLSTMKVKVISGKDTVMGRFHPLISDRFSKRQMVFCELMDPKSLMTDIGELVIAEEKDAGEIAEAFGLIGEFAGMYAADVQSRCSQILHRIRSREGIHMVIRRAGRIVSHGNTTAESSASGMVGGIFTLPEYRGQGLAGLIISALCASLARRGKSACLFYDNPEAGSLYRRLGFRETGNWTILGVK